MGTSAIVLWNRRGERRTLKQKMAARISFSNMKQKMALAYPSLNISNEQKSTWILADFWFRFVLQNVNIETVMNETQNEFLPFPKEHAQKRNGQEKFVLKMMAVQRFGISRR